MDSFLYIAIGAAVAALIFAVVRYFAIMKRDAGNAVMQDIAKQIQDGAAAFLKAEYTWLAVFVAVVAVAIGMSDPATGLGVQTAIAFVCGALASAIAGYFGMFTATRAAVRTTQAATNSLADALGVSFSSGVVMGMSVVGLALLGVAGFTMLYGYETVNGVQVITTAGLEKVLGFSFGASSIALFSRVGGGIFTKAADVGADLVGKVEAGIPEDDPRNPGTIADNVGDNVGDVAGMGADLFESYVGSIIAAMTLGAFAYTGIEGMAGMIMLPLAVAALGIFASIIGTFFVKANNEHALHGALFKGLIVASLVVVAATWWLTMGGGLELPAALKGVDHDLSVGVALLGCVVAGLAIGVIIGKVTEYYTSTDRHPVQNIAKQSETGAATNIIHGLRGRLRRRTGRRRHALDPGYFPGCRRLRPGC